MTGSVGEVLEEGGENTIRSDTPVLGEAWAKKDFLMLEEPVAEFAEIGVRGFREVEVVPIDEPIDEPVDEEGLL